MTINMYTTQIGTRTSIFSNSWQLYRFGNIISWSERNFHSSRSWLQVLLDAEELLRNLHDVTNWDYSTYYYAITTITSLLAYPTNKKGEVAFIVYYFLHISSIIFFVKLFNGSLIPLLRLHIFYYSQLCRDTPMAA